MSTNVNSRTISGLDGLRGLAALAVFGVHYQQIVDFDIEIGPLDGTRFLANGEHGVALFFILSGLLLGLPFWRSILCGTPWPSLKTYALRRLARILPAYYLALTLLILISGLWRFPAGWDDILLHYSFLFNFTEFSIFSINAPFWTLAVEIQFYLLLPVLFIATRRWLPWQIFTGFLLSGLLAYGMHYCLLNSVTDRIAWPGNPVLTWIRPYGAVLTHSLLAHLPHFILGVAGGWIFTVLNNRPARRGDIGWRLSEAGFWFALLLLFILLASEAGDAIQVPYGRYGLPLVPLLLTVLVLSAPFTLLAKKILDSRMLRGLGIISYGFYIYHLPCLRFIDQTMLRYGWDAPQHWFILALASLALTLLLALLSYRLVERPVLKAVRRRS